jgi:ribosome maturation factor RimP
VDDCAAVHQAVQPRIEVLQDNRDVYLEVSSPGLDRKFRTNREFAVFTGRGARLLRADNDQWVAGIIVDAGEDSVTLENDTGRETVAMELIRKARLDESQEVR